MVISTTIMQINEIFLITVTTNLVITFEPARKGKKKIREITLICDVVVFVYEDKEEVEEPFTCLSFFISFLFYFFIFFNSTI